MADQGDLQNWLKQLKKRAEAQQRRAGGGGGGPRPQRRPTVQPEAEIEDAAELEEYTEPAPRPSRGGGGMSATDRRLAELREKKRREQEAKRQRQQKQAREAKERAQARLQKQEEAARQAEEEVARARQRVRGGGKRRRRRPAPEAAVQDPLKPRTAGAAPSGPAPQAAVSEDLHERLLQDKQSLRDAIVLREILGPPKALAQEKPRWEP
jgi:hypothetical protein